MDSSPTKRSLYSSAPPGPQDRVANNPTLLFSWFCTIFALAIILTRLAGRKSRSGVLFTEDKVMFLSIIPLLIRMALAHVILIWGTNNIDVSNSLSDQEIFHRSVGSRLVLASRIFYAMFIWTAKFTVSEFLKRLTASYWKPGYQFALHSIRIFLLVSFVAVLIATLAECQPFDDYWQVVPDPGAQCRQAYAQLFTMAVADIITDCLLVVFPMMILLSAPGIPLFRRIKLALLFLPSAANIIITAWRVVSVVNRHGLQQRRTVYASGEILAAAAVSNAVILGSFLRDRGVKRAKWRGSVLSENGTDARTPSTSEDPASPRRQTITRLEAGSDENLFEGMCFRSSIGDAEAATPASPRPARAVSHADLSRHTSANRERNSAMRQVNSPERPLTKTVTFSDPGGLLARAPSHASTLGNEEDEIGPLQTHNIDELDMAQPMSGGRHVRSFSSDTSTRAGTPAELQDVGGLLGGRDSVSTRRGSGPSTAR